MNTCGCIFPRDKDVKDVTGCLKQHGHNDDHLCKDKNGRYIVWQEDYACMCGCWAEWEKYGEVPCIIYYEISKEEAGKITNFK